MLSRRFRALAGAILAAIAATVMLALPVGAGRPPGSTTPTVSVSPTSVSQPATATVTATFDITTAYSPSDTVEVSLRLGGTEGTGTFSSSFTPTGLSGCVLEPTSRRFIDCEISDPTTTGPRTLVATIEVAAEPALDRQVAYDVGARVIADPNVEDNATLMVNPQGTTTTTSAPATTTSAPSSTTTTTVQAEADSDAAPLSITG